VGVEIRAMALLSRCFLSKWMFDNHYFFQESVSHTCKSEVQIVIAHWMPVIAIGSSKLVSSVLH